MLIARLFCREGHDPFRESRQAGKAVIEIASRANDLAVRALMVDLLNADRSNIEKLHTMERKRRDALRSQGIEHDPHNPLARVKMEGIETPSVLNVKAEDAQAAEPSPKRIKTEDATPRLSPPLNLPEWPGKYDDREQLGSLWSSYLVALNRFIGKYANYGFETEEKQQCRCWILNSFEQWQQDSDSFADETFGTFES